VRDWIEAGGSVHDWFKAGLSARDWFKAGLSVRDWIEAGLSVHDWFKAGGSVHDWIKAGGSVRDWIEAGRSVHDWIKAGGSVRDFPKIPKLENPYTTMLAQIKAGNRIHNQRTFGPHDAPPVNICNTPMCTAGHLVSMAGVEGWKLKEQFGFAGAATLLHYEAHPDWPCQNFGVIPQEWAMGLIEHYAALEESGGNP
jgi:hypothetical protein